MAGRAAGPTGLRWGDLGILHRMIMSVLPCMVIWFPGNLPAGRVENGAGILGSGAWGGLVEGHIRVGIVQDVCLMTCTAKSAWLPHLSPDRPPGKLPSLLSACSAVCLHAVRAPTPHAGGQVKLLQVRSLLHPCKPLQASRW